MNLRSVDLNLLTIFDAVITEQNLSRAAAHIGMSQPAISAALARLRLVLKDELFVRTGRGVRPTPKALELQQPIRDILNQISATLAPSHLFDPSTTQKTFCIASIDYGGITVIPALLEHLQALGSSARINVWPQYEVDLREKMRFGQVDFVIDNTPITDSDFSSIVLNKEKPWCLVRRGHPDIHKTLSLQQFLRAGHIVLYPQGDRVSQLDEYLIQQDIRRNHAMKVPSFFNMPYLVQTSDLICCLPERVAHHFAALHDLAILPVPLPDWVAHYYLMWHTRTNQEPAHQWLRDIIITLCKTPSRYIKNK